ncbi:MAG: hypothetical protein NXH75_12165 [Halobacteriovoraceae bacterium]|nr:hypothetical protein [Halobacteriovoraceae bacterium]
MGIKYLSISILLFSSSAWANEKKDFSLYVVKPGDTINTVLFSNNLGPLYGSGNYEEKTLKLNRLSKESTKKLEVGEVIILPIPDKTVSNGSSDAISIKSSATITSEQLKQRKRGNNNWTLWGEYFNRKSSFTEQNTSVRLNQNFAFTLDYLYRDRITSRQVTFNPMASLGVYTQSNTNFSNDPTLTAELSPSLRFRTGLEIEHREYSAQITPFTEFEYFSYIDNNGTNSFSIRKDQILWAGAQIKKQFSIKKFSPYIGTELATSLGGSNEKSVNVSQSLNGEKLRYFIGTNYEHHYNIEIYYETLDLKDQTAFQVDSTGMRFGYRF